MQNQKNTENLDDTFNAALNAAFERNDAMNVLLNALASTSDEEIQEMRETVAAARKGLKQLQGIAKPTTKQPSK